MEKKIDSLIEKASYGNPQKHDQSKPFQRFEGHHRRSESRQDGNYRERAMYKAVCAQCNKECEVPFKPTGERPVYCKDCFSKRRSASSFNTGSPDRQRDNNIRKEHRPYTDQEDINRKFIEKKKTSSRKRKKSR